MRIVEEAIRARGASDQDVLGMDAALSCYLSLGGQVALQRIEQDYLGNAAAHYSDAYAADHRNSCA